MALSIAAGNLYLTTADIQISSTIKHPGTASALALSSVNEHVAEVARMFYSHMGGKPTMVEQRAYIGESFIYSKLIVPKFGFLQHLRLTHSSSTQVIVMTVSHSISHAL